jgi:hypothetical protein
MGSLTDANIAAWQEACGIEPATGERAAILQALSQAAFDAIKIIELEQSGIRDGDGYWHGSDVIGAMTGDLMELCRRLMKSYREPRNDNLDRARGSTDDADLLPTMEPWG